MKGWTKCCVRCQACYVTRRGKKDHLPTTRSLTKMPNVASQIAEVQIQNRRELTVVPNLEFPLSPKRTRPLKITPMIPTVRKERMRRAFRPGPWPFSTRQLSSMSISKSDWRSTEGQKKGRLWLCNLYDPWQGWWCQPKWIILQLCWTLLSLLNFSFHYVPIMAVIKSLMKIEFQWLSPTKVMVLESVQVERNLKPFGWCIVTIFLLCHWMKDLVYKMSADLLSLFIAFLSCGWFIF